MSKDDIYANPIDELPGFRFDEEVVRVFPDMIKRSVPGYSTIIAMTGLLAGRYATPGHHLLRPRLLAGRLHPGHAPAGAR